MHIHAGEECSANFTRFKMMHSTEGWHERPDNAVEHAPCQSNPATVTGDDWLRERQDCMDGKRSAKSEVQSDIR